MEEIRTYKLVRWYLIMGCMLLKLVVVRFYQKNYQN